MTIHESLLTDPTLRECMEVAERTRLLCHELLTLLTTPHPSQPLLLERSRKQKQLNALMAQLKALHRTAIMSAREAKDATTDARREVDRLHLQLQNLYYEQRHLRGEVNACRDFPHKYTSLPLVSEKEFLEKHEECRGLDAHELMIERLGDEKKVREQLEGERKELVARKQALIAENKRRKEDLASLDEQLQKFIESSRPIQTTFMKEY